MRRKASGIHEVELAGASLEVLLVVDVVQPYYDSMRQ